MVSNIKTKVSYINLKIIEYMVSHIKNMVSYMKIIENAELYTDYIYIYATPLCSEQYWYVRLWWIVDIFLVA